MTFDKKKLLLLPLNKRIHDLDISVIKPLQKNSFAHSLYKFALDRLPTKSKMQIGLGKYGFFKRALSHILYFFFFGNIFDKGDNIMLVAEKNKDNCIY